MSALQDLFLPEARRTGQVVAEFDMGATEPGKTQYPGGYCAGLTIHWLSLRSANRAWPADQKSTYGAEIAKKAAATYAEYVKGQGATQTKASLWGDVIPRGLAHRPRRYRSLPTQGRAQRRAEGFRHGDRDGL